MQKIRLLIAIPLILAWAVTLRPTFLLGPATYIMVSGHSMEPGMHTGDLVIAHRQSEYSVGDVIAFKVNGGYVIHRIFEITPAGTFITKGDNNPGTDPWEVPPDQVAGKMWVFAPSVGQVIGRVQQPVNLGLLAAGVMLFLLLPLTNDKKKDKPEEGTAGTPKPWRERLARVPLLNRLSIRF